MGVGTFIGVGKALETSLQRVARAEELGYDSAYVTHIAGRDSLIVLAAYAARSERIKRGHRRAPDLLAHARGHGTGGRHGRRAVPGGGMVLGLGVSHRTVVENWYGSSIDKPVTEMRDYAGVVRAIFRGEDPPESERFPTSFHFVGYKPRPDLPIYIAALSPAMLRLAGEIGDGVMLWLCNPEYIREVVVPEVTKGRERAGKTLEGFDIVAAVPAAVTDDVQSARDSLRGELLVYFTLPFYRAAIERSGFGDDIAAFDAQLEKGDNAAAVAAISDRYLEQLAAIGDPTEAAAAVRALQGGRRHLALHRRRAAHRLRHHPPSPRRPGRLARERRHSKATVLPDQLDRLGHLGLAGRARQHLRGGAVTVHVDPLDGDAGVLHTRRLPRQRCGTRDAARRVARLRGEDLLAQIPVVPGTQIVLESRNRIRDELSRALGLRLARGGAACHERQGADHRDRSDDGRAHRSGA